ncbi:MAG: lysophospholipid acyltransferase family protein [Myxococcota bacterium]
MSLLWGLNREVNERLKHLELPFNRFGVDKYGVSRRHLRPGIVALTWLYRNYFDVHVHGIHHVPGRGRAMLVGNHSGGVALDAAVVATSMFWEKDPPRLAQGMAEKFMAKVPFFSSWTHRWGQFTGLPEHAEQLLRDDRLLMVFPEGARGTQKLYSERHSLVRFGTGFVRLALKTKSPIVPLAFLGGGEAIPTIYNSKRLGKILGAPYVPVTPYGLTLPLPVRLDVIYSEPMVFAGHGNEEDEVIFGYVDEVKARVASLIEEGRRLRRQR